MNVIRGRNQYALAYFALSAVFCLFLTLSVLVTYLNTSGTLVGLDGAAGVMDHQALWDTLDPLSNLLYTFGDLGCHQEQARSLMFNGNQMPFCIRDTFIFAGFAIGFILHGLGFTVDRNAFLVGAALVAITPIEWSVEHFLGFMNEYVRAVVSVISGIGATMMLNAILIWETKLLEKKKAERDRKE